MPTAYVFTAHGGPEVETFADLPRPTPGPGQVLVAVRAAGVNPVDWKRRAGFLPPGAPEPRFPVARARTRAVLDTVAELASAGVLRPFVTAAYPLAQAPRALRAVEAGHARGKIVIEIAP
ncbi:zinc-binding dehydrogenase [Sphaerisporangium sp. NBC_01403]|uniref:zinc-binding dehydrogenase n=1 Tax=Sphaerisporangium sp. NBC_01403 TaxID=2903599 RepID=UPI0032497CE2